MSDNLQRMAMLDMPLTWGRFMGMLEKAERLAAATKAPPLVCLRKVMLDAIEESSGG